MYDYLANILSAFSQVLNAIIGGNPNESISGRSHREGWWIKRPINLIFFWMKDHCKSAYEKDKRWAEWYLKQE